MKLLIDECLPKDFVTALRMMGHDVTWASEVCRSQPDAVVLDIATRQGRVVITEDNDYGDLTIRDGHPAVGVVITNTQSFPGGMTETVAAICAVIEALGESLIGNLTIIAPHRVRQRNLTGHAAL